MSKKIVKYYKEKYQGKLSEAQCDMIDKLKELDEKNGMLQDLKHLIYNLSDEEVEIILADEIKYGGETTPIEKKLGMLRGEQTVGVGLMYYTGNCMIGDSVGLGKTVEVAGLCNLLKEEARKRGEDFNAMFLTEKTLCAQVRREMIKFTGSYVDLVEDSRQKNVNSYIESSKLAGVTSSVVAPHGIIRQPAFAVHLEQLSRKGKFPYDLLIVDESSILGGGTTEIVKAFRVIRRYFKRVIFLNATPFETKLDTFYNQLSLLDESYLPTKQEFTKQYVVMDYRGMFPKPTGTYKNKREFKEKIGYRYFARTREKKGAQMRNCSGGIITSKLSPIQKEWLKKTQMSSMVYDCPSILDKNIEFTEENVPKLGSLSKLLKEECGEADTVLMFVYHKETQQYVKEWLGKKGYTSKVLNGETKAKDRLETIESFKNGEFKVLITNVQKGLNFGNCNHCIFYRFDSNPSKMIQFEGRMTRSFDIENKSVYILCSEGKELKDLNGVLKQRAVATTEMTNTDISVVLELLTKTKTKEEEIEELEELEELRSETC